MAENLSNSGEGSQAKREKLTSFSNWLIWSGITESMLIEKDVWDLILEEPCFPCSNPILLSKGMKEDQMAVGIA